MNDWLPLAETSVVFLIMGFAAILAIVLGLGIWQYRKEKKRTQELGAWADKQGYRFSGAKDRGFASRYQFIDALRAGSNHYAWNIISGENAAWPFDLFDYHYETHSTDGKGNRQTHHHYLSVLAVTLPVSMPHELKVRPEGFFDKLASVVGFDDIDFESDEFSRKFHVKCDDKKFAYTVITAQMMEFLLKHRKTSFEIERQTIAFVSNKRWKVEELQGQLDFADALLEHLPDYLIDDLKSRTRGS